MTKINSNLFIWDKGTRSFSTDLDILVHNNCVPEKDKNGMAEFVLINPITIQAYHFVLYTVTREHNGAEILYETYVNKMAKIKAIIFNE